MNNYYSQRQKVLAAYPDARAIYADDPSRPEKKAWWIVSERGIWAKQLTPRGERYNTSRAAWSAAARAETVEGE